MFFLKVIFTKTLNSTKHLFLTMQPSSPELESEKNDYIKYNPNPKTLNRKYLIVTHHKRVLT